MMSTTPPRPASFQSQVRSDPHVTEKKQLRRNLFNATNLGAPTRKKIQNPSASEQRTLVRLLFIQESIIGTSSLHIRRRLETGTAPTSAAVAPLHVLHLTLRISTRPRRRGGTLPVMGGTEGRASRRPQRIFKLCLDGLD